MKRRRDSQLDAFRPHRIVVVLAVESDHVEPGRESRRVRRPGRHRRYLPPHHARHHHDFQPELLHHVLEFRARLLGSMHRDHRGGRHAVGKFSEKFRDEPVERAAGRAARFVVGMKRNAEPGGRIEHGEIHSEFVEPFVEQARQELGRAIASVPGRQRPECLLRAPSALAFLLRRCQPFRDAAVERAKSFDRAASAEFFQLLDDDWPELQPMPVGVDHRMLETRAYPLRL